MRKKRVGPAAPSSNYGKEQKEPEKKNTNRA